MKVIRAKSAGFCFGVERAIDIARKCTNCGKNKVYTDGPLIHNRQMMECLEKEGIFEIGDYLSSKDIQPDLTENPSGDVLLVRAHGVSPERREYLRNIGLVFKDATCPDVGKIAGVIKSHAKKGYTTIIVGDGKHPEVIGLLAYTEGKGFVVKSNEEIDALPLIDGDVCMVSQSTMFTDDYQKMGDYCKNRFPQLKVIDTICNATKTRQGDVKNLADEGAEAIIVIGGKHSANTIKLAIMAKRTNLPYYHIETLKELDLGEIKKYKTVGVTAGASTPDFLITEVCNALQNL